MLDTQIQNRSSPISELLQRRADDVVLAAGLFKPNAPGNHELVSVAALGCRQMLKARGAYLGERIILGVTPLHVHAVQPLWGNRVSRSVACWARDELRIEAVPAWCARHEPKWPALLLSNGHRNLCELRARQFDDDTRHVLSLLLHQHLSLPR